MERNESKLLWGKREPHEGGLRSMDWLCISQTKRDKKVPWGYREKVKPCNQDFRHFLNLFWHLLSVPTILAYSSPAPQHHHTQELWMGNLDICCWACNFVISCPTLPKVQWVLTQIHTLDKPWDGSSSEHLELFKFVVERIHSHSWLLIIVSSLAMCCHPTLDKMYVNSC